jgi:hypothetical protein
MQTRHEKRREDNNTTQHNLTQDNNTTQEKATDKETQQNNTNQPEYNLHTNKGESFVSFIECDLNKYRSKYNSLSFCVWGVDLIDGVDGVAKFSNSQKKYGP